MADHEATASSSRDHSAANSSASVPKPPAFKATKLWNDLLEAFKVGVKVKRRRYHMKQYEDCFTASEAVDWLHKHLMENPHFGADVSRQQALQLARKFLENKVFQDVRGEVANQTFQDDNRLYHFLSPGSKIPVRGGARASMRAYYSESTIKTAQEKNRRGAQDCPVKKPMKRKPSFSGMFKSNTFSNLLRNPLGDKSQDNSSSSTAEDSGHSSLVNTNTSFYETALSVSADRSTDTTTYIASYPPETQMKKTCPDVKTLERVWANVIKSRVERLCGVESVDEVLDANLIKGSIIMTNTKLTFKQVTESVPSWLLSAMKCLVRWPNEDEQSLPRYPGFEQDVFRAICDFFQNLQRFLIPEQFNLLLVKISRLMLRCRVLGIRGFQYLLLILPTPVRNQLHVLMRFMCKISINKSLELSKHLPTRELVIQKFSPCILNLRNMESPTILSDDVTAIRLVSFMMENCYEIFKTQDELQVQVSQQILHLEDENTEIPQVHGGPVYCEQISPQDYQASKLSNSQKAIKDLLENIVKDDKMSEKQKKRSLKQFEKTYPGIYYEHFPQESAAKRQKLSEPSKLMKAVIMKNMR